MFNIINIVTKRKAVKLTLKDHNIYLDFLHSLSLGQSHFTKPT